MSRSGSTLLVDIGSTVVKTCLHHEDTGTGSVELLPRQAGVAPGRQVRALVEARGPLPPSRVRICSSANGGVRVGVLGLSRRHSCAAAVRAATAGGGNVVYERLLGCPVEARLPPVDLLVLVGGVDGADHRHLREALARTTLAGLPHEVLVWAGADTPDVPAGLAVDHVVPNVLDERLRASMAGVTDLVHQAYMGDMVDSKGLGPLSEVTDTPIWPTPAVVELAVERMVRGRRDVVPAPLVVVDVGGATTDVLYCAELRREGEVRVAPGESVARQVFTDLGVVSSLPALRRGLAVEPELSELAAAVAPQGARALHQDLCSGAPDVLEPPVGFLACLFLALRRLTGGARPLIDAGRVAGFLITGGAWTGTTDTDIRRVIGAACGSSPGLGEVHVDRAYRLWTDGLLAVPRQAVPGS